MTVDLVGVGLSTKRIVRIVLVGLSRFILVILIVYATEDEP